MKQIFNHYHINSRPFLNKKILSAFLLFLTIFLTACGGGSSENSTTGKETEVVPKKESKVDLSVHPNKWYKGSEEKKIIVFENNKRPIADILNAMSTSIDQLKRCDGNDPKLDTKYKEQITSDIKSCVDAISQRYNISSSDCDEIKRFLPKTTGILSSDFVKKSETTLDELKIKLSKKEQVEQKRDSEEKSKKVAEETKNSELSGNLSEARKKELLSKLKYEDDLDSLNKLCAAQNKEAFFYIVGQVHKDSDKLNSKFDKQLIKFTPQNFSGFLKEVISKKNIEEIGFLFRFINEHHQSSGNLSVAKIKTKKNNNASFIGLDELKDYGLCQKDIFEYAKSLSIKDDTSILSFCLSLLGTLKSEMSEDWVFKIYKESISVHIKLLNALKEKEIDKDDAIATGSIEVLYIDSLPYVKIAIDAVSTLGEIQSQKALPDIKKNQLLLLSIINEPLSISKNLNLRCLEFSTYGKDKPKVLGQASSMFEVVSNKISFLLNQPYRYHQLSLILIQPKEALTLFKEIDFERVNALSKSEVSKDLNDPVYYKRINEDADYKKRIFETVEYRNRIFEDVDYIFNCLGIEPEISRGTALCEILSILNTNFKKPTEANILQKSEILIDKFHFDFFTNIKNDQKFYEKFSTEILKAWDSCFGLGGNFPKWLNPLTQILSNPILINGIRNKLEESSGEKFVFYAEIFINFKTKDEKVIQLIEKALDDIKGSTEAEEKIASSLKRILGLIKSFK